MDRKLNTFSQRQKMATTVAIFFGNICLAIGMNVYSPAVVDFSNKYAVGVDDVAVVFTILTVTYMIGALLTSFIYRFLSRQFGVILGLSGIASALYLTPHCPSLETLFAVACLLGLCNGLYNASQSVWIIEMWQPNTGPFIQGQHFFYAVGSLVPSLLLGPFLAKETDVEGDTGTTVTASENVRMWIPFTITGIMGTVAVVAHAYLFVFQRYTPQQIEVGEGDVNKNIEAGSKPAELPPKDPEHLKLILIVLSAIFLGFYQGMEMVTMQFISTFAQFAQNLSETEGAMIMTGLTASYAVARGLGILANMKIPAIFILAVNLLVLFVSNGVLIAFGSSTIGLWMGVTLLGIGYSTIFPSFCAYIEKHLEFTNAVGSLMLVCGSLVASIFPVVIGQQIEHNSIILIYVNLFSTTLITVALVVILKFTFRRPPVKL